MLLWALIIGIVAGLRAMTPLAAMSWAATRHILPLEGSWLAFFGWRFTAPILTLLALVELVTDQLPSTPSRKVPVQFGTRIVVGAVTGAAIGIPAHDFLLCGGVGVVGAIIGTLGGAAVRGWLAKAFGRDTPAALIEDFVAIGAALLVVTNI